jgi:hypothetical protein
MKQKKTVTELRKSLYQTVDSIISTGAPLIINRKGHQVKLSLVTSSRKLSRLKPHKTVLGNPDDLVSLSPAKWTKEKIL